MDDPLTATQLETIAGVLTNHYGTTPIPHPIPADDMRFILAIANEMLENTTH